MKPHQRLDAWKLSFSFVKEVYIVTAKFPSEERFGLISQLRRAAVSVPTNIAEGAARQTKNEFRQFLYIALGSSSELDTLLQLSLELGFVDKDTVDILLNKLETVSKLLFGLIKSLRST